VNRLVQATLSLPRRDFLKISGAALLSSFPLSFDVFAAADEPGPSHLYPYGTHIYREPSLPLAQIHEDLPLLKRLGFTMVKIQESWSADERREGEIDLSRVASVVSDARQNGLLVYFGFTMEQAPAWFWKKFPDARMVLPQGEPLTDPTQYLLPSDGKPGPCWNHSQARAAATRFMTEAVGQISRFDNVLVWNVWQEVLLDFNDNALGLCYCPNTLAAFREWLQTKYANLEALNRAWRTSYGEWVEVEPPRRFPKVPSMIDWRYYMENVYLAEALRFKAQAVRSADPKHRTVMAHASSPRYGGSADWRLARAVDLYGASSYPGWGEMQEPNVSDVERLEHNLAPLRQMLDVALQWDYIRSATVNGAFWTAELQGGRAGGGLRPGRVPDAADIRRWVLGAMAGGARGICFWNHRNEISWDEAYGFGLLGLDSNETARADEAGRVIKAVNRIAPELFSRGACPRADVAILVDEDLRNFVNACGEELSGRFVANVKGIHSALFQEGIPVCFLDAGDLHVVGSQYKVVVHPLPLAMDAAVLDALREYVRDGGVLISGPCPGRFDRFGFGTPGEMPQGAIEVFGAEHEQLISLPVTVSSPKVQLLRVPGENKAALNASYYLQYLKMRDAQPILKYGQEIVGCKHSFGKGAAYLIGTPLGLDVQETGGAENREFLGELLHEHGVAPDRVGQLIRRRRVLDAQEAWFFFNLGRAAITERVPVERFAKATDLFEGPVPLRDRQLEMTVGPLDIACVLMSLDEVRTMG